MTPPTPIAAGDTVTWLTLGPYEYVRHKGTVTEINGNTARVREADGYCREHKLFVLRRLDAAPSPLRRAVDDYDEALAAGDYGGTEN